MTTYETPQDRPPQPQDAETATWQTALAAKLMQVGELSPGGQQMSEYEQRSILDMVQAAAYTFNETLNAARVPYEYVRVIDSMEKPGTVQRSSLGRILGFEAPPQEPIWNWTDHPVRRLLSWKDLAGENSRNTIAFSVVDGRLLALQDNHDSEIGSYNKHPRREHGPLSLNIGIYKGFDKPIVPSDLFDVVNTPRSQAQTLTGNFMQALETATAEYNGRNRDGIVFPAQAHPGTSHPVMDSEPRARA